MFRLIEIQKNSHQEIKAIDGLYTVFEFLHYQIEFTGDVSSTDTIFIEDEPVKEELLNRSNRNKIIAKSSNYFHDYFGFARISFLSDSIQVNILVKKMKVEDVEDMILYLFEKNHLIFDSFLSKSSINSSAVFGGNEYIHSSKYLNFIEDFYNTFDYLFNSFKVLPHTIVRKEFSLSNYSSKVIDFKSIEWVLQNLDSVSFDRALVNHPDAICINAQYGVIDEIGSENIFLELNNYENQIVLGSFYHLLNELASLKTILNRKITENTPKDDNLEASDCVDFRIIKIIPFIRLRNNLFEIEKKISKLQFKYLSLFKKVKPMLQFPKLTSVFSKSKHYRRAYEKIRLLYDLKFDIVGETQLLNIRKLSKLYELFNLTLIVEVLSEKYLANNFFAHPIIDKNSEDLGVSKWSVKRKFGNYQVSLYYEPIIKRVSDETELIIIGSTQLSPNTSYCCPDFVLELRNDNNVKYCIMDSKYSPITVINSLYKFNCVKKYLLDIGISNRPYQKADFLVLLHPDSSDTGQPIYSNREYFPQILTISSKVKSREMVRDFINQFLLPH